MPLPKVSEMESYQSPWLTGLDLQGKKWDLKISQVEAKPVMNPGSKKNEYKYILFFEKTKKPMVVNKTNVKQLAAAFGEVPEEWVGKTVSIHPKMVKVGHDTKQSVVLTIGPDEPTYDQGDDEYVDPNEININ